ncbi:MAG: MerR family transcriptional regulator [Christensenellales bacterium]
MFYTVGEMAKRLGVPPSTLRYYDKEGLLPFVERSSSGIRMFKDADFEWLQVISCLKKTGMQLADIKRFVEMAMQGDATIDARLALILQQKQAVQRQIDALNDTLKTLEFKEWYYQTAKEAGTTEVPRRMKPEELPEEFRETRKKLRGE